ncbi:multidrug resistance-associated protein 5 [Tanacetum coccineum]
MCRLTRSQYSILLMLQKDYSGSARREPLSSAHGGLRMDPEYRQAVLESTHVVHVTGSYRKVIGLDGCFLTHTCKGQLLTAIGRDGNNQMYPITWFVVGVENKDNWAWFLSLLQEDLELGYGGGLTVISDGHKGLLEAVAASCTVDQQFLLKMEQIKELDPAAHKWLVERNPNSWCKAFFEMDRCSAAFENGISESFNSKIVPARGVGLYTLVDSERFWELSGIPCVHAMVAYYHMNMEPELGSLGQSYGNPAPLPPIKRKRLGRPRKQRIRHPTEDEHHVSRVGRVMHCHNCWEVGHNKKGCQNQPRAKPPGMGTSSKSQSVPNSSVDQSRQPVGKPLQNPTNSKGKGIAMEQ